MFVLGVTGGIGSGKTAATDAFQELGIEVVDADLAARVVVEPGRPALDEIEKRFGTDILLEDGNLDRAALRKIIFERPEERKWLESLTHPLIRDEIINGLRSATSPYVILSSPLLIESGQYHLVNHILVIDVPETLQVARTCLRDNNPEEQVKSIIAAQINRQDRLLKANDVIVNDQDLSYLKNEVAKLHEKYLGLAK
jgi:dephospho-CoA kinase